MMMNFESWLLCYILDIYQISAPRMKVAQIGNAAVFCAVYTANKSLLQPNKADNKYKTVYQINTLK